MGLDCEIMFLFYRSIFGPSTRPLVALLIKFVFRQLSQVMVGLPIPEGMIWFQPTICGVAIPSLVCYHTTNDFFFSGHTSVAFLGMLELFTTGSLPLKILGILIAIFEALTVLALRAHWTMDVIAGVFAAFVACQAAYYIAPACDRMLERVAAQKVPVRTSGTSTRPSRVAWTASGLLGIGSAVAAIAAFVLKTDVFENVLEMGRQYHLETILFYAGFWFSLALFVKFASGFIPTKRAINYEFASHFVTVIHSCFCTYYGWFCIDWRGKVPSHFDAPNTDAQALLMQVMCGYFLYDIVICLYVELIEQGKPLSKISWELIFLHHVSSFLTLINVLGSGTCGLYIAFTMPYIEWTSPFLSSTWMMHYHGVDKQYPLLTTVLKGIMALLWTFGRMVVLNYVYYCAVTSPHVSLAVKIIGTGIPLVSIWWQYKIMKFVSAAVCPGWITVTEKEKAACHFVVDSEKEKTG